MEGITKCFKFDNQSVFPSESDEDDNDNNAFLFDMAMKQYSTFFGKMICEISINNIINDANRDVQTVMQVLPELSNLSSYIRQLMRNSDQFFEDPSKLMLKHTDGKNMDQTIEHGDMFAASELISEVSQTNLDVLIESLFA